VSTNAARFSYANEATAPAVYAPTPGSSRSAIGSLGITPSCSLVTCFAKACKFLARA
jgi:hypothetical protein